jgi:ABC-type lipoprotein release transport system permease subunit
LVSERTYEIGLRQSIGATDPETFGQFLLESVSLSLVGGLFGAALGGTRLAPWAPRRVNVSAAQPCHLETTST